MRSSVVVAQRTIRSHADYLAAVHEQRTDRHLSGRSGGARQRQCLAQVRNILCVTVWQLRAPT